jgi:hypothetical protein
VKKRIAISGDAQAEAIALVLRKLPWLTEGHDVVYVPLSDPNAGATLRESAIACEQQGSPSERPAGRKLFKKTQRVRFPALQFNLLWPLTCVNAFDRAEPPDYPFGRFPYGDSFILGCVRRKLPAETIMQYYAVRKWPPTWPNLDKLFQSESVRLSAQDAHNDVKIGAYILKYFRKKRLFWAAKNPSNQLFGEMVFRLLHACFGPDQPTDRQDLEKVFYAMGPRDLLAPMSVPIHPLVVKHFHLEWYDPGDSYAYFDREFTYEQYFSEMIEHALAFKA